MDENSSQYTVLARRYRPQAFDEVVGQAHVVQALRNAIQAQRVAHAYMFTGSRGVGKTSMARILAKSLNCPSAKYGNPCNDCEICNGITAGSDIDVLEIDGASNRGIDDIRSLRQNVNVMSMRSTYKLYIIDEVHMLTKEAFNALLKTLEEPPANVKFVFCTTEPNKIPDTILSRCQRFDFGTIQTSSIVEHLKQIAQAESVDVELKAFDLIARRAAGSMRDSQSLFDQLLAFGENRITATEVHRLLGTASDDRLIEIVDALISRRRDVVLGLVNQALTEGIQLGELTDQLLNYLRDLIVLAADAKSVSLSSVSEAHRDRLSLQSARWGLQTLVAAMQVLADTKARMQRTEYGRALVELALIRISLLENLESLDRLLHQLKYDELNGIRTISDNTPERSSRLSNDGNPQTNTTVVPSDADLAPSNAVNAAPDADRPNEKKNEDDIDFHLTAPIKIRNRIEFRAGFESQLFSQIVDTLNDTLQEYIKHVNAVAISEPNILELTFPKNYHFNKQFCERPEVLNNLETAASDITGQRIRIVLRVAEDETNPTHESELPQSTVHIQVDTVDDSFVQRAMSVFGASVERVVAIAEPSPQKE